MNNLKLKTQTPEHIEKRRQSFIANHPSKYPRELYGSKTYKSWECMKQRCNNPKNSEYFRYGARGITVNSAWMTFEGFLKDMGVRPNNTSLERKDSNGNYELNNCCWATPIEQANNTRRNRHLTIDGDTRTVAQWARITGIDPRLVITRLNRGWDSKKAVTPNE